MRPQPVKLNLAMYICRGCGTEVAYSQRFKKYPVCGIKVTAKPPPGSVAQSGRRGSEPNAAAGMVR